MLAGLIAGAAVTAAAYADGDERSVLAAGTMRHAASAAAPDPLPPVNAATWRLGARRLQERHDERARRREVIVAASRSVQSPGLSWPSPARLSGWFGERRGRRGHVGLDLDGETGDPIVAAGPGVVEWAGWAPPDYRGYGQVVLLRHSASLQTLYAHLSDVAVHPGDVVEPGQFLGAMGTTGNVTGSHLHFEVRLAGTPVNPRDWLPAR